MKNFFVVQSQDPFTDARTAQQFELVRTLASRGNKVKVMLVQNAVLAARLDARAGPLFQLLDNRISLYADEFSLALREIKPSELLSFVVPAGLDLVINAMQDGDKVIWN